MKGMNKFMRRCLITALVLLLIGCVISGTGWVLGGFRQMEKINEIGWFPFVYQGDSVHWSLGFADNEGAFGKDWEKKGYLPIEDGGHASFSADSCRELELELGGCSLYLQESEDDQVKIDVEGNALRFYWLLDGSTLRIRNAGRTKIAGSADKIYLSLPTDFIFDEADVTIGAGTMRGDALRARDLDMVVGAGTCDVQELAGNEISMEIGAGDVKTAHLDAEELSVDVGAGEADLRGVSVRRELDLNLGAGNAEIEGEITGELSVECGMGNVAMRLAGSEDDHAYDVSCNMGNVRVGSRKIDGLSASQEWNSGQRSVFEIECNMGNVEISFAE
ncbi:MAG: DUF4097 family beta strand repeat-containing protein [Bacteroidales bacterium]|nr:DUF4097 family beta strand repeat-containing protein [Bacteroidales bacterium]MCM1414816.1 DUF4097 family beta strand repeat-containing protein [bacterium]MCM1422447.1 DUF4097 family beta strand repeat-containing protein [bacterium]